MSKKPSLAESLRQAAQASEPPAHVAPPPAAAPQPAPKPVAPKTATAFHAATRTGKKKVTAPLSLEDHKRLRHLALDRDATTEALLTEAINNLFVKYGVAGGGQGSRPR